MPTAHRACIFIYALEAGFSQVAKNYQVFCQTVGGVFLTFLPKIRDVNSICQTAGDALNACAKMQSAVIGCLQYLTDQSVVIAVSYISCCDDLMILSERNQSLNPVYVVIQVVLPHFLSSPLYMAIR